MNVKIHIPNLFAERQWSVAGINALELCSDNPGQAIKRAKDLDEKFAPFCTLSSDERSNNAVVIGEMIDYPDKFVELFSTTNWNPRFSTWKRLNFKGGYPFTEVNSSFQKTECPQPPQGLNIPNPVSNL